MGVENRFAVYACVNKNVLQQTMKTKIILLALVAAFAITMFSSCSNEDCFGDDLKPCEKSCETKKDSTSVN